LELARTHELIPSLKCCVDSNSTPKYALLVLVCSFTSISKVVSDKIGTWASYLLSDRFDNLEGIGKIHGPLLLIHGSDDNIIPCHHSKVLYNQAKKHDIAVDLQRLEKCNHNTMDLKKVVQHMKHSFAWQFETARKKDQMARWKNTVEDKFKEENNENTKKNEDEEEEEEVEEDNADINIEMLKDEIIISATEEKKMEINGKTQRIRGHGFINAPNYDKIEICHIQIPAYAYLRPNPNNSVQNATNEIA